MWQHNYLADIIQRLCCQRHIFNTSRRALFCCDQIHSTRCWAAAWCARLGETSTQCCSRVPVHQPQQPVMDQHQSKASLLCKSRHRLYDRQLLTLAQAIILIRSMRSDRITSSHRGPGASNSLWTFVHRIIARQLSRIQISHIVIMVMCNKSISVRNNSPFILVSFFVLLRRRLALVQYWNVYVSWWWSIGKHLPIEVIICHRYQSILNPQSDINKHESRLWWWFWIYCSIILSENTTQTLYSEVFRFFLFKNVTDSSQQTNVIHIFQCHLNASEKKMNEWNGNNQDCSMMQ